MDHNAIGLTRLFKRMKAAVGYHELGMTRHALEILDKLAELGDIGEFALVADILRDEFLRGMADQLSAASALKIAAELARNSARRAIRMTLAICFGNSSETESTRNSLRSLSSPTEV